MIADFKKFQPLCALIRFLRKLLLFFMCAGRGAVGSGSLCRDPDVTLSMTDADLVAMFQGALRPFSAYTSGKLQVQGDMKAAMKLEELIKLLKNQHS